MGRNQENQRRRDEIRLRLYLAYQSFRDSNQEEEARDVYRKVLDEMSNYKSPRWQELPSVHVSLSPFQNADPKRWCFTDGESAPRVACWWDMNDDSQLMITEGPKGHFYIVRNDDVVADNLASLEVAKVTYILLRQPNEI